MKKCVLLFMLLFVFLFSFASAFAQTDKFQADFVVCNFGNIDKCMTYDSDVILDSSAVLGNGSRTDDLTCAGTYYVYSAIDTSISAGGFSGTNTVTITVNGQNTTLTGGTRAAPKMAGPFTVGVGETLTITASDGTYQKYTFSMICSSSQSSSSSESEAKPVTYPEDDFGAYYLNADSKKEYIWFHSYDICKRFMPNPDFCSDYQH